MGRAGLGLLAAIGLILARWGAPFAPAQGPAPIVGPGSGAGSGAPPTPRAAAAHPSRPAELRRRLGLAPEYDAIPGPAIDGVRIAVLDYGFEGVVPGEGRYLPASVVVVEDYDADFVRRNDLGDPEYRKPFEPGNRHGRDMAQIIWAATGSRPSGPKFFLLNANGPTMLRRAVRFAAEQRVDLILFSGSFDGGGNGDGRGPIDRVVDEAVGRGIIWVNASGNYGGHVVDAPVRLLKDGYLRLRSSGDVASVRFTNRVDENVVTVTLTWTDYRDQEDAGTDKDLDLFVEDPAGRRVGSSEKRQVAGGVIAAPPSPDDTTTTRNPRERVVLANLAGFPVAASDPESAFRIRVRARSGRFLASDRVRILVTAARESFVPPGESAPVEAVTLLDASGRAELYPPADHSAVLTVGDSGAASSVGPTLDNRIKPDAVLLDSRVDFSDGLITAGSSNAAAMVAGVAAALKASEPRLTAHHLFRVARAGDLLSGPLDRARLNLHTWQTPARARLAAIVQTR